MKNIILLNKKEGETPLQALLSFRQKHKIYKDIKMTYAGRLDPMAKGILLILSGKEIKNKQKYLNLDKEYKFEILFGFTSDTYDILGKVISSKMSVISKNELEHSIRNNLKSFIGKFQQKYPLYSSKTVKGKQLFEYGRAGEGVKLPEQEINVKKFKFLKLRKINNKKLLVNIEKRITKVKGDFRQKEILKIWRKKLTKNKTHDFFIGSFKINCGSGTYVRVIVDELGRKINIPALTFSIKRTKLGKYAII